MAIALRGKKIWVAGHQGMVGSALVRRLEAEACTLLSASRAELDLTDQTAVDAWVRKQAPDVIFLAAAKVGGIHANTTYPVEFLQDNLLIETNVIHSAYKYGVKKLIFLASACMYPKLAPQPIQEDSLLSGALEPTNEPYAIAKIAGTKLCQAYREQYGCDFITVVPTNSYGPHDNFCLETGHVPAALMLKAHLAKEKCEKSITLWGTGSPKREFIHVDDMADAIVFAAQNYSSSLPINIGSGHELAISDLAAAIMAAVGYTGEITYDRSKPDGAPRKLLNCEKLTQMGWRSKHDLSSGLKMTYQWFCQNNIASAPSLADNPL